MNIEFTLYLISFVNYMFLSYPQTTIYPGPNGLYWPTSTQYSDY